MLCVILFNRNVQSVDFMDIELLMGLGSVKHDRVMTLKDIYCNV